MILTRHNQPGEATPPQPAPNFNGLARTYRWLEWFTFGPALGWCRCAYLDQLTQCRRALVLGDGDGRFTARLLRINPTVEIDAADASSAMLAQLLRNAGRNSNRIRAHLTEIRNWQPPHPPYDLIVTHFFLDCLADAELRKLAATTRQIATENALWLVSEFAVTHDSFGRIVARPLVSTLYWVFGLLTGLEARSLPDHRKALENVGFQLQKQRKFLGGLLCSELYQIRIPE